jgi:hypothetical protein
MANSSPSITYTPLVEPTSSVQSSQPAPFDAVMAYLLGQCCSVTYHQFDAGLNAPLDFSQLTLPGYSSIKATSSTPFSVYEANEPGPTTGDVGDYFQVPAGFGVELELTPTSGSAFSIIVVALRGTRTWSEWLDDAEAFPVPFAGVVGTNSGLGSVHAGFYGLYTIGENGKVASSGNELSPTVSNRATGSIAAQVGAYVSNLKGSLPIYVTGHSLGGALATLCALDIAYNFSNQFTDIYMYSLASPRVAMGLSDTFQLPIPTLSNQNGFLANYQTFVPNSYRIVHAADIIPILPPSSITLGPLIINCAHVTDAYQLSGSGAEVTAEISNGAVTGFNFTNHGSDYGFDLPATFSGGGGTKAMAQAYIDIFYYFKSVTLLNGGSGYTSAPTVEFLTSGSLTQNVVSFCAQTGDIGNNHGCINTYVPYLAELAAGFS